jgi:hypothetical protein
LLNQRIGQIPNVKRWPWLQARDKGKGSDEQVVTGPSANLCPSIALPFPAHVGTPIPAKCPDQRGLCCQLSHQDLWAHLWPEAKFEVRGQRNGPGLSRGRGVAEVALLVKARWDGVGAVLAVQ